MIDELEPISKRIPIKKHRLFIDELFKCNMNGTKAYQNVYGADYDASRANASKLLANANISEEVEHRLQKKAMSANEVIARLAEQAQAQYSDYLSANGTVNLAKIIEDGKAHLIKKIKRDKQGYLEVEFYDAKSALDTIAKYYNLLRDTSINFDVDLDNLTDDQLDRIANGEDVFTVLATSG
jgi:hypothetical protein